MPTLREIEQKAPHEASGSTFASLLHSLATEHERVQLENARLLAEIANRDSSLATSNREDAAVQELLNRQQDYTRQESPSLNPSTVLESQELLITHNASEEGAVFEISSRWTQHPELFHHRLTMSHDSLPVAVRGLTVKMMDYLDPAEYRGLRCLVIFPDSKIRHLWITGCICLLLFDLVFVPLDVCFELEKTLFTKAAHWVAMVYWSLDLVMNFLTGFWRETHLELRLCHIAKEYARTWLCFDVFLVLSDYMALFSEVPAGNVSILRMMRWGRFMRLFRLARLSKVAFLKPIIRALAVRYHLSRTYVEVLRDWLFSTFVMLIWLHLETCFWHAFGASFEDGWIQANNLESASVGRLYAVSMHWSCIRLIGSNSRYALKTQPELAVDTCLMLVGLVVYGFMLAGITVLTITKTSSKPFNLWKSSISYSRRHDLSLELQQRLEKWIKVSDFGNIGEIAETENTLLCTVPKSLNEDLLFEARIPFLSHKQFITDMARINERAARHLCYEAMTEVVFASDEVVFDRGDAGQAMSFISHGRFEYKHSEHLTKALEWQLKAPASISEAVLWTAWEHTGLFRAMEDPKLLSLDHERFALTVQHYSGSFVHAVRYAKHFVQKLNQTLPDVHDLTAFEDLSIDFLNENVFDASDERHFIFISHFKVEAGTEATLMFSALKNQLMNDPGHAANNMAHPIFIDSENLTDLARLQEHVMKADVIVLLLTPGVLSRPWCLIEIATAIKHHVKIVLVDIHRPGCKFQYPNDQFYDDFLAGKTLDVQSISLLESQGISLEIMAEDLRRIFQKIALPFSPHRSEEVREAELHDILKRCNLEFTKSLPDSRSLSTQIA